MLTKENRQKIICLSGLCDHSETDSSCLFLKVVDKGPEYWVELFEKIVEDEIRVRNKALPKKKVIKYGKKKSIQK